VSHGIALVALPQVVDHPEEMTRRECPMHERGQYLSLVVMCGYGIHLFRASMLVFVVSALCLSLPSNLPPFATVRHVVRQFATYLKVRPSGELKLPLKSLVLNIH
jgi:hypothetical protein